MDAIAFSVDITETIRLYSVGLACGIILSIIPMIVGSIINFAFKTMKGG